MPPEEDARAILRLALRHEHSLAASLDPAFAQENWGFLAQQCVEQQPPLSHDLVRLQMLARRHAIAGQQEPTARPDPSAAHRFGGPA